MFRVFMLNMGEDLNIALNFVQHLSGICNMLELRDFSFVDFQQRYFPAQECLGEWKRSLQHRFFRHLSIHQLWPTDLQFG